MLWYSKAFQKPFSYLTWSGLWVYLSLLGVPILDPSNLKHVLDPSNILGVPSNLLVVSDPRPAGVPPWQDTFLNS